MQRSLAEEVTRPLVLIALSALLGLLFYLYYRFIYSPYQAFAGTGVKGPKPRFLLGSALDYMRLGEMQMYYKCYQSYGPVFGFYMGTRPVLVVADHTLLDLVLTADHRTFTISQPHKFLMSSLSVHGLPSVESQLEDEVIQKARKHLSSILFLPKLLKLMVPVVLHNYETELHKTLDKCTDSPSVDVWSVYQPYCLNVVLDVLGLSTSGKLSQQISAALTSYFNTVNRNGATELILTSLFGPVPCLEEVMKSVNRRVRAEEEFNALVGMVSEAVRDTRRHHRHTGVKRNYLQVLLDHPLTDDQVVSYILLTLLVGFHTIFTTLTYTTYQLAANPLHQQKLYNEISNLDQRETIFYERVDSLEFLDAVVQESLRLHCLTPKLSRVCVKETSLKGATILKNTRVEIPVNFLHHLHNDWSNPHSFSPERFMAQSPPPLNYHVRKLSHKQNVFLPFGRGPHSCLGMMFTVACVKLSLTEIFQRFRFSRPTEINTDFQLPTCPVRRPTGGLHVTVLQRQKRKRQMSFATIVKSAMHKQSSADTTSS